MPYGLSHFKHFVFVKYCTNSEINCKNHFPNCFNHSYLMLSVCSRVCTSFFHRAQVLLASVVSFTYIHLVIRAILCVLCCIPKTVKKPVYFSSLSLSKKKEVIAISILGITKRVHNNEEDGVTFILNKI